MKRVEREVLVIGSGIAGLTFALKAAQVGRVVLITKKERADSNTNYAQGGIAAVMSEDDSSALHVRDTLVAGAGLSAPRCPAPALLGVSERRRLERRAPWARGCRDEDRTVDN